MPTSKSAPAVARLLQVGIYICRSLYPTHFGQPLRDRHPSNSLGTRFHGVLEETTLPSVACGTFIFYVFICSKVIFHILLTLANVYGVGVTL